MSTFGILFFLLLGGLVFFGLARIMSFTKSRKPEKRFLAMLFLSVLLIGFGLAWAYTSFLESEPYAAYMGLVVFGGLGMILGGLGMWKVTGSQTATPGQTNDENKSDLSWQKGVAIVLVLFFTLALPMTWLLKSVTRVVSDKDRVSTFLFENLLSDRALPVVIRKALEYEAWLTRMDEPLEPRLIKAALSGTEPAGMIELFDYVAPEKERQSLLDNVAASFYAWIHGDEAYPALTIQTGTFLNNLETNADNLLPWIYKSFPIPACSPGQIQEIERGDHNNDLKKLVFCIPPESLQRKIAPIGAALIREKLRANKLPDNIYIGERIREKISAHKLSDAKKRIRTLFFLGSALWILPIALLVIGLLLAARSVKKAVAWLSWPLIATGLLGMVTASCLPGLSFLHSVPKDMPGQIPGYMLGIGRKLGIDLAVMLEKAMFTPFLLMAVVGGLLLVITFRKQIVLLAINAWHSFGMVFGKQAV
jgi:Ca2+/Na+ antiporter